MSKTCLLDITAFLPLEIHIRTRAIAMIKIPLNVSSQQLLRVEQLLFYVYDLAAQGLVLRLDNKRMHSVGLAETLQGLRKPVRLRFGEPVLTFVLYHSELHPFLFNECLSVCLVRFLV